MLGIQVLALDRHKKVAQLNRLMESQPLEYAFFSISWICFIVFDHLFCARPHINKNLLCITLTFCMFYGTDVQMYSARNKEPCANSFKKTNG